VTNWQIRFEAKAAKAFRKLDRQTQQRIRLYLRDLSTRSEHVRQFGKALSHDRSGFWRYRVGKYRIICKLLDGEMVIVVMDVGKRDSIYD